MRYNHCQMTHTTICESTTINKEETYQTIQGTKHETKKHETLWKPTNSNTKRNKKAQTTNKTKQNQTQKSCKIILKSVF